MLQTIVADESFLHVIDAVQKDDLKKYEKNDKF